MIQLTPAAAFSLRPSGCGMWSTSTAIPHHACLLCVGVCVVPPSLYNYGFSAMMGPQAKALSPQVRLIHIIGLAAGLAPSLAMVAPQAEEALSPQIGIAETREHHQHHGSVEAAYVSLCCPSLMP